MRLKIYLKFIMNFDQLSKNSTLHLPKNFILKFKFVNSETLNFFSTLKTRLFFIFLCNQNLKELFLRSQTLRNTKLFNCLDLFLCSSFLHKKTSSTFFNSFTFLNLNFYKHLNLNLLQTKITFTSNNKFSLQFNLGE